MRRGRSIAAEESAAEMAGRRHSLRGGSHAKQIRFVESVQHHTIESTVEFVESEQLKFQRRKATKQPARQSVASRARPHKRGLTSFDPRSSARSLKQQLSKILLQGETTFNVQLLPCEYLHENGVTIGESLAHLRQQRALIVLPSAELLSAHSGRVVECIVVKGFLLHQTVGSFVFLLNKSFSLYKISCPGSREFSFSKHFVGFRPLRLRALGEFLLVMGEAERGEAVLLHPELMLLVKLVCPLGSENNAAVFQGRVYAINYFNRVLVSSECVNFRRPVLEFKRLACLPFRVKSIHSLCNRQLCLECLLVFVSDQELLVLSESEIRARQTLQQRVLSVRDHQGVAVLWLQNHQSKRSLLTSDGLLWIPHF